MAAEKIVSQPIMGLDGYSSSVYSQDEIVPSPTTSDLHPHTPSYDSISEYSQDRPPTPPHSPGELIGEHIRRLTPVTDVRKLYRDVYNKWEYTRDTVLAHEYICEYIDQKRWTHQRHQGARNKLDAQLEKAEQACGLKKMCRRLYARIRGAALRASEKRELARLRADLSQKYTEKQTQRRTEIIEALFSMADKAADSGNEPRARHIRRELIRYSTGEYGPFLPVRSRLDTSKLEDEDQQPDGRWGRPSFQKISLRAAQEVTVRCDCFH